MNTTVKTTMDNLIKDDNYLCSMNFEDLGVSIILLYTGTDKVYYALFEKTKLLFEGNDYRPSPMYNGIDTIDSCVGLLAFLTLQEGDTDAEYFAKYTTAQIKWSKSSACETLRTYIYDYEGGETEYSKAAIEYFKNAYTN